MCTGPAAVADPDAYNNLLMAYRPDPSGSSMVAVIVAIDYRLVDLGSVITDWRV